MHSAASHDNATNISLQVTTSDSCRQDSHKIKPPARGRRDVTSRIWCVYFLRLQWQFSLVLKSCTSAIETVMRKYTINAQFYQMWCSLNSIEVTGWPLYCLWEDRKSRVPAIATIVRAL
ncbi:jg25522 [Pararge aegeria aegeria]|uniref:Jg25522 protein n=1 Tax=Pararge aegeria aegeria TaxID=348720 RepID=A0A8S4RT23_9NEOP|nr:jg25522 [Pararge aegeria aegeria]